MSKVRSDQQAADGDGSLGRTHHRLPFRSDIEGLRALAVLMVVAYHAHVPFVSGGFVGVDVFFVISGYLITALLTEEIARTGTISLPAFFERRIRRLLPAAIVVLIATLVISAIVSPPLEMMRTAVSARAAAGYLSNIHFLRLAQDYFTAGATANPLLHTWSLSVEEQFYLVWPLVLLAAQRFSPGTFNRRRLGWVLTALAMASFVAASWYMTVSRPSAFYGMPLRAWEFACGGLVSLVPARARTDVSPASARSSALLGWAGLLLVLAAATSYSAMTEFPGASALVPVVGTSTLLIAGSRGGAIAFLSVPFMQWIGQRSYSWYLWHWPMLVLGTSLTTSGGRLAPFGLAALALVAAAATYRFVETPFRARRSPASAHRGNSWRVIRLGLATSGVAILSAELARRVAISSSDSLLRAFTAAVSDLPAPYQDGCVTSADEHRVRVCVYGDSSATRSIALFGDSHATQWFPALESIAKQRGWKLLVLAKSRCATADVPVFHFVTREPSASCERWRSAANDTIRERRPELVVLSNTLWYVRGPRIPPDQPGVSVATWEAGMLRTLGAFHAIGIPVVVLRDTPWLRTETPTCLAHAGRVEQESRCATERAFAMNADIFAAEQRAIEQVPSVRMIDLTDALCNPTSCEAIIDGIVVYSDGEHLTATMARRLAPELEAALGSSQVAAAGRVRAEGDR